MKRFTLWLIWGLRLLWLGLAAALLFSVTSYAMTSRGAPPAAPYLPHLPFTDVNPYGANFFLNREVEQWKRERTLQMAREAGITWAKEQFPWEEVEPRAKGNFQTSQGESTWAKFDQVIALYNRYGVEVIARLDRPPDWSRQDNSYKQAPPDRFEDFGDYVFTFVKRYRGLVHYIQIWNEPNIFPEWGNQPVDPQAYTRLLQIAYARAKAANPDIVVLSAPLAITLEDTPGRRNLSDLVYLEEMYQAGTKGNFDILSSNAFGMQYPPGEPANPRVLNFQRVLLQRSLMEKYGDAGRAIWFNEYGWDAAPPDFAVAQLTWQRVSEAQQAKYTVAGVDLAAQEWPWTGVFNIWYFRQPGFMQPENADYYFRMVDVDFTPRQVYHAVREAAAPLRVAGTGLAEETNPAVVSVSPATNGPPLASVPLPIPDWQPHLDAKASAGQFLATAKPGASISFTFEGGSVSVLTQMGPQQGRALVTLDGQRVPRLPLDSRGNATLDFYQPDPAYQVVVPIARGLGAGRHTVRLVVDDFRDIRSTNTQVVVDGFLVQDQSQNFPLSLLVGSIAGLLLTTWALWRTGARGAG
ncbi:MAG: hypothetical protein EXR62_04105 [Chloroflexi bacterium]|nr:hypothetical protein [Chloroflexota bacterium]